jgi:hypothetical protein
MRIRGSKLYPHPVLWYANDDYVGSKFEMDMEHEYTFGELKIKHNFTLNDDYLINLIEQEKLAYCLHVECPMTMFRNSYYTSSNSGEVSIESRFLTQKVEVSPFIIAMEDIENYRNDRLHEDYFGLNINIPRGSIMGISDYRYLIVDKEKTDLGRKESIFSFVKNQKDEPMKIDTDDQKIIIMLKEEDFNRIQMLQTSARYQPVIFSMFIVPALIYALETISDDIEEMREKLWFRSLEKCFSTNGIELNKSIVTQKTSFILAQMLLENPISKALIVLNDNGGEY